MSPFDNKREASPLATRLAEVMDQKYAEMEERYADLELNVVNTPSTAYAENTVHVEDFQIAAGDEPLPIPTKYSPQDPRWHLPGGFC